MGKIRNGFVSNSSSSSFIISKKGSIDKKVTIAVEVDLSDFVSETFTTKEEVIEHIKDEYCYGGYSLEKMFEDEPYVKEQYDNMMAAIERGEVIYKGLFSSEGEPVEAFLCDHGLPSGDYNVIESEGGY